MGIGSSLKKGLKKISKGLKKVGFLPLAISKKVWKEVKRAWNTKLGRIVLIAAAVWATGGLLAQYYGIASGASAFSFSNAMAGLSQGGSVLAGKMGLSGVSQSLAVPGAQGATAAGAAAAAPATAGAAAAPAVAPGVAAAAPAAAGGGGGIMAAAGNFATQHPLLTYGLLQTGGQMIAAANTPTAAEEARGILRATQRANDLTRYQQQTFSGQPTARFATPGLTPQQPRVPTPGAGLLEPDEPEGPY